MTQYALLIKLLGASIAITLAIKYLAPYAAIPATPQNALIGIFLPTVVMAIVLGFRSRSA
jgi:hypothetical protein